MPRPLYFFVENSKQTRNKLARPEMGTIFLVICRFTTPITSSLDQYFTTLVGQTLYQATSLENNTSLLQHFIAESRQDLECSGVPLCLEEAEQQAKQVVMFLLLLFKLSSQLHFVSFSFLSISILSLLPFSNLSLLPFHVSPSFSIIPSFSSDQ